MTTITVTVTILCTSICTCVWSIYKLHGHVSYLQYSTYMCKTHKHVWSRNQFKLENEFEKEILSSHYVSAAVPIWCFQSTTTLVHQLTQLASKDRMSSQCHCAPDFLCWASLSNQVSQQFDTIILYWLLGFYLPVLGSTLARTLYLPVFCYHYVTITLSKVYYHMFATNLFYLYTYMNDLGLLIDIIYLTELSVNHTVNNFLLMH